MLNGNLQVPLDERSNLVYSMIRILIHDFHFVCELVSLHLTIRRADMTLLEYRIFHTVTQHPEFPVVIRESCYTSRTTAWFPRHRKM